MYQLKNTDKPLILGIYVDDILLVSHRSNNKLLKSIIQNLEDNFVITKTQDPITFIGIQIEEKEEEINLQQTNYINKILRRYDLDECNPVKTPGVINQKIDEFDNSPTVDPHLYQEMIGSLMYLSTGTRPDITFHVNSLSQYNKNPKQVHLTAVKRIYRYLKGTKNLKLTYPRNDGKLNIFTDASWNSTIDARSFSGCLVKLGDCLIHWKYQKQNIVALSTCEAELLSICEGTRELIWFTTFLSELQFDRYIEIPIILYTDSKSAIDWVQGNSSTARTKHLGRKYHFVKEEVKKGNVKLQFTATDDMQADILTKSLNYEKTVFFSKKLGLNQ